MTVTAADIEAARRTIAGQVLRTPMLPAPRLSALTGAEVHVKYENLQVTNSFKERGALNKLASLTAKERSAGVIAMSAGNHAQAVAYHAARLVDPRHHRDAGDHADCEDRGDADAWRQRRAGRRNAGRGASEGRDRSRASAASPGFIPMTTFG